MTKHERNDLNLAHLVARSGINKDFENEFLIQTNKNDWLPIHLSKNKYIAEILFKKSKDMVELKNLIIPCIKNYSQSSQTQYGHNLEQFLIEKGFSPNEASLAKNPPSDNERIELGIYYFSLLDESWYSEFNFNPVNLALSHSNSHFFFALRKSNLHNFMDFFKPSHDIEIGSTFFLKNQAFQIKQQLKQYWHLNCSISNNQYVHSISSTGDYLKNLEGA